MLTFAGEIGNQELKQFCAAELAGHKMENEDEFPDYRTLNGYVSYSQLSVTFFSSAAEALQYMSQNFRPQQIALGWPIVSIEDHAERADSKQIFYLERPCGEYVEKAPDPDRIIYFYAAGDSIRSVIRGIRSELSRRLVDLLPA